MNKKWLLLGVCLAWPTLCLAQEKVPPPEAPIPVNAGDPISWVVTFTPIDKTTGSPLPSPTAQPGTSASAKITEMTVTKENGNRRIVTIWTDGKSTETWIYRGYRLTEQPGQNPIYIMFVANLRAGMPMADMAYTTTDFPEMKWVSPKTFTSVESYNGTQCYHFEETPGQAELPTQSPPNTGSQTGSPTLEAWVDVKTKLPVALKDATNLQLYRFQPSGGEPLQLPPRFSKAYDKYMALIQPPSHVYPNP